MPPGVITPRPSCISTSFSRTFASVAAELKLPSALSILSLPPKSNFSNLAERSYLPSSIG